MATTAKRKKTEEEASDDIFVTSSGLEIKVTPIPPMLLQRVMNSIAMPKRPTYDTKTVSGRTETWPMDEESAEQTEHGKTRWEYYIEERTAAQSQQNDRVMMAAFLMGTECDIPENGWDKTQKFLGLEVPTDPDHRRAHYLATELEAKDVAELMQRILSQLQLPEELIADAEASFQRSVRDGPK